MSCFPLLLLLNLNVDKHLHFSSLSALVCKFCHYLTTGNKNNCSLLIFSILYMILLGSAVPCPPHLPMAQAAGLFNLLFYWDVYFLPLIAEGAYSSSLEDIIHFFDYWRKMRWMPLRVSMQVFFIAFRTHTPLTSSPSLCVFLLLLLLLWLVIFFLKLLHFSLFLHCFLNSGHHLSLHVPISCTLCFCDFLLFDLSISTLQHLLSSCLSHCSVCLVYPCLACHLVFSASLKWFLQINADWHKLCVCLSLHLPEVLSVVLDL